MIRQLEAQQQYLCFRFVSIHHHSLRAYNALSTLLPQVDQFNCSRIQSTLVDNAYSVIVRNNLVDPRPKNRKVLSRTAYAVMLLFTDNVQFIARDVQWS